MARARVAREPDPRTPVLVGAGQSSDPIDAPGYRRSSPVELAAEAARAALADAGADPVTVAAAIDTVAAIRQFEISVPGARQPFGGSDNPPRSVAARIGADPRRAILEVTGGQGPQHLITELAGAIKAGHADVVLTCGAEAMSTVRHLSGTPDIPDWSETVGGQLEDRGFGLKGLITGYQVEHGLFDAPAQYALFENARRARLGMDRSGYAASMGALFAPFTEVAKANPHAAAPVSRTAAELATVTEGNRLVVDPYPRLLVARDAVNQGAAVLLMSVARARELGVPRGRWVFLHAGADVTAPTILEREDLSDARASVLAVREALSAAGIGVDDLAHLDLYSCFPVAVSTICDGLGLTADDPRGLTVTGGLPYFGGPGNNYSMHAIAEILDRCRAHPGSFGLVGANGGVLSKYAVGVYATTPTAWRSPAGEAQRRVDGWPRHPVVLRADGAAVVETWTVTQGRRGRTGIVVGRLEATGERFLSTTVTGDDATLALLGSEQPVGCRLVVRSFPFGNRVALDHALMDDLVARAEFAEDARAATGGPTSRLFDS
jgi:acetyl-CoA C-acetyltransferase